MTALAREAREVDGQLGFRDVEHRLRQLSERGDLLEKLAATVDCEIFPAELATVQGPRDRSKGGRRLTLC